MTKKLFWDNPYQTECTTVVTSINENKVKVDQTIFYAFSGGQESDDGTIGGIKVIEAKKEGDKENIVDIEYTLETTPLFKVGDVVQIIIDPEKRSKLRRLHSAAHLVYYKTIEMVGPLKIMGSNVTEDKARMDFLYELPISDKIPIIETNINSYIAKNIPITMYHDQEKMDLRWWTCENNRMPCGGTHVQNTNEIGPLKLTRVNKGKGKERIEIFLA